MLRIAITGVLQSLITSLLTLKQTAIIKATETTFSASKKNKNDYEFRIFFPGGFNKASKKKEAIKIAIAETIAPVKPLIWFPTKGTKEKTGLVVTCSKAIASISCCLLYNPVTTGSVSRKTNKT